jgi:uncharacterized protein YyaL (SSP411 family)
VSFKGCYWCKVFKEQTTKDQKVTSVLKNFTYVEVDKDLSPTIDKEISQFHTNNNIMVGYPLTIIIDDKKTRFIPIVTYPPDKLINILTEFKSNKAIRNKGKALNPQVDNSSHVTLENLDDFFIKEWDGSIGGWDLNLKIPDSQLIEAMLLHHLYLAKDTKISAKRINSYIQNILNGGIHDFVSGGFHRISLYGSWNHPHFEKLTIDQINMLYVLSKVNSKTPGDDFQEAIDGIKMLLNEQLKISNGEIANSIYAYSSLEGDYYLVPNDFINKLDKNEKEYFWNNYSIGPSLREGSGGVLYRKESFNRNQTIDTAIIAKLRAIRKARQLPNMDESYSYYNHCRLAEVNNQFNLQLEGQLPYLNLLETKLTVLFTRKNIPLQDYSACFAFLKSIENKDSKISAKIMSNYLNVIQNSLNRKDFESYPQIIKNLKKISLNDNEKDRVEKILKQIELNLQKTTIQEFKSTGSIMLSMVLLKLSPAQFEP